MYHDKELLSTRIYEIFESVVVDGVNLDKLLTPTQQYDLMLSIINGLPYSNLEKIMLLNKEMEIEKISIGESNDTIYKIITICLHLLYKTQHKDIIYKNIINVFKIVTKEDVDSSDEDYIKSLLYLLSYSYSLFIENALEDVIHEGLLELVDVELSALHNNIDEVKATVSKYEGTKIETVKLKNSNKFKILKSLNIAVNANKKEFDIKDLIKKLKKD